MFRQNRLWYKFAALFLALSLLVPVLAACGSSSSTPTAAPTTAPTATATPTAVPTATAAPTTTPTPTPNKQPVKIGYDVDWSGPAAMSGGLADPAIALLEWNINEKQGGVLGGRPVQIVKYDDKTQPALAAAGTTKLILEDKVTAMAGGGAVEPVAYAIANVSDPKNVPFFMFQVASQLFDNYKWTVASYYVENNKFASDADYIVNTLKPKTVAYFYRQGADQDLLANIKKAINALSPKFDTIYDQAYPQDTQDFSSFLTKIKYAKPDVLVFMAAQEGYVNVAKQVMGLGGWGGIQVYAPYDAAQAAEVLPLPGAQGWYIGASMFSGTSYYKAFVDLWAQKAKEDSGFASKYGAAPTTLHAIMYTPALVAVKAIQLANTDDPAAVARAARSGNLELDTPLGHMKIGADGKNNIGSAVVQIQNGQLVSAK